MTIKRIFIANRGEIAVRTIQTCRELGIETVLAVSEADRSSLGAKLATRAVCIGSARSTNSYLKIETIVDAAMRTGADALHPGYGFLSENPRLADLCEKNGVKFIGPTADQIAAVGDKLRARAHAEAAGVPVVPGGAIATREEAEALADRIGFPLLVKAVAGGGGRGMKRVNERGLLAETADLAMAEAASAFGDSRVYLERYVASGRHVEVQILGDGVNVIHLGDRDCSVQRRYQKVIEEAPAPNLSNDFRNAIHEAALKFARHIGYRSLGTVEFLVDCERDEFYFLEMNARIQVEHPVTEAIVGLDLVAEQIEIANGRPLRLAQSDIRFHGHAIECRINAETVEKDFRPSPGVVSSFWLPGGFDARVDTHMFPGASVPPYYDSMIAKVIVRSEARAAALEKMVRVLKGAWIEGVDTNISLHRQILAHPDFIAGEIDTNFLTNLLGRAALASKPTTLVKDASHGVD
jgi:acetyl-CoA carboxylase, biotin carboxylase subunit